VPTRSRDQYVRSMAIDPTRNAYRQRHGGLSGPRSSPSRLRMVYDAAHAVKIPVIGMGGIRQRPTSSIHAGRRHRRANRYPAIGSCATEKLSTSYRNGAASTSRKLSDFIGGMFVE